MNPDFLLQGGGNPFAIIEQNQENQKDVATSSTNTESCLTNNRFILPKESLTATSLSNSDIFTNNTFNEIPKTIAMTLSSPHEEDPFEFLFKKPIIILYSQKMKGLKDLLLAEKLNTHAISLQITAQSVATSKCRGFDKIISSHLNVSTANNSELIASRPKRSRRD